ncbi:hypothetical protein TIFTF001_027468 [Ficus carica]|uniref:Uncharacterized protein n=1 Tax=Ficus carica TaxID=3494 RepID=A0AA88DN01_FICCA|nr:hypothetical protein TIFTF001_027468 [Ficus carica]
MEKAFVEAEINGNHFHCILLEPSFTANNPPLRHVAVYTRCLTYSQPITFHPFVKRFCRLHNISLAQLLPNFWIIFIGIWILWHKHFQRDLTMDKFLYVHSLRKSPQFEGWQYLRVYSRSKIEKAITLVEGTLKSSHEWKTVLFFFGGRYHKHPTDGPEPVGVWSKFRSLVPSPPRPVLDVDSLHRINMIFALPSTKRHWKSFITTDNLENEKKKKKIGGSSSRGVNQWDFLTPKGWSDSKGAPKSSSSSNASHALRALKLSLLNYIKATSLIQRDAEAESTGHELHDEFTKQIEENNKLNEDLNVELGR